MTRTALYRHYDAAGALLYVGITDCLSERDKQHRASKHWHNDVHRTETQWCVSRDHALALERVAIEFERPRHNIVLQAPIAPEAIKAIGFAAGDSADLLRQWLKAAKVTQVRFAAMIGITQASISRIMSGTIRPSLETAVIIDRITDGVVPAGHWFDLGETTP